MVLGDAAADGDGEPVAGGDDLQDLLAGQGELLLQHVQDPTPPPAAPPGDVASAVPPLLVLDRGLAAWAAV